MNSSLTSVEQIYIQMQIKLNMMLAACTSEDDRKMVSKRLVEARINFYSSINKAFHEDDPALIELNDEAKLSIASIKQIEEQLGDISKVIGVLTTAVKVGFGIASKVIAA